MEKIKHIALSDTFDEKYRTMAAHFPTEFSSDESLAKIRSVCDSLMNAGFNLTSITGEDAIIDKHIIDSLYAANCIRELKESAPQSPEHPYVCDIGSGGGFPALPIASVLTDCRVIAIDSTAKKVAYMKRAAASAHIEGFTAICGRAEELCAHGTTMRMKSDFVCARALAKLNILMELCSPYVKLGGYFIAMKGVSAETELDEAKSAIKTMGMKYVDSVRYTLSDTDDVRSLLIFQRKSPIPAIFPRRYAQMVKAPL